MIAELPRSGRPKTVTTEENLNIVAQCFVQSPKKSTRKASNEYGIPLLQGLNEDDPDRRTEFCEWYAIQEADPQFYKTIFWSDEATFKLNGTAVSYTHLPAKTHFVCYFV